MKPEDRPDQEPRPGPGTEASGPVSPEDLELLRQLERDLDLRHRRGAKSRPAGAPSLSRVKSLAPVSSGIAHLHRSLRARRRDP